MAHAIETAAFHVSKAGAERGAYWGDEVGKVPWHGLGTFVGDDLSADEMMKVAGLDWEVELQQAYTKNSKGEFVEVPERQALVRTTDQAFFDFSSKQWKPVQNRDVFKFFDQFVKAGDMKMEAAGALRGGKIVFALAHLGAKSDHTLADGDVLKSYVMAANAHEVGNAFVLKQTNVRVECANKLSIALGADWGSTNAKDEAGTFKMTHYREFDEAAMDEAQEMIGLARDRFGRFAKIANQLKKIGITNDIVLNVIAPIYAPKIEVKDLKADFEKHKTPTLQKLLESLNLAPGAEPGTAWGLLNAVTHYEDHVSGRSNDARQASGLFGAGAHRKLLATRAVMAMAA